MIKTVHVVPHSHWDREWYFTTSRSKIYLMHNLKKIIDLLQENSGFEVYTLDGQLSLLDDYLAWRPEDRTIIEQLVKEKKLIIGPWYTQTDQMVISGESIVRNMLYGMNMSKKFGPYMNLGYVPDSFGQSAAMPQIYKEFGIEDTLFWRGVSDDDVKQSEFRWRGEDGSVVNAYQIPAGYYIGGDIPEDEERLKNYLHKDPYKTIWSRSSTNQVLFPNGFDQAPARENISELVDRMKTIYEGEFEFKLSTYVDYIESVKEQHPELEEIAGELLNGKLMRIHKSIFSSRSDLKKLNTQVQNYLVNVLEPLLSLSQSLGFDYPVEVVKEIWKLMFENAAHDSIGSCVSDTTNEDVYLRYKQARDLAENLAELKMREIVMHLNTNQEITATVFNVSGRPKSGVVEAEFYVPQLDFAIKDEEGNQYYYTITSAEDQTNYILGQGNVLDSTKEVYRPQQVYKVAIAIQFENLPAFGYKNFYLDLEANTHRVQSISTKQSIENEFYIITVNENHTLDILDKVTGRLYKNQAVLEENGDDGDSFNYSPPRKDLIVRSSEFVPKVEVTTSEILSELSLSYLFKVPQNLEKRAKGVCDTDLPIVLKVSLKADSPMIEYVLQVDNRFVDSHRVCIRFNSEIASQFSKADHQFGSIRRPVVRDEMALWQLEPEKWNEVPIAIETCQSFVTLDNSERGVAVIPKGVREYEIVGERYDTIRLTLFRTYGFMGRENLVYRPGRASGETVIATPDAQCHKHMEFEFAVVYYQGDMNSYGLAAKVSDYLKVPQVYQYSDYLNTRLRFTQFPVKKYLAVEHSLFQLKGTALLSVVKKAEERPGYIIRVYNGDYKQMSQLDIEFVQKPTVLEIVNLKEDKKEEIILTDTTLRLPALAHNKFITLYVEF
ncbi:mannosylglycerate hydrolase [Streptococcus sp. zg-86]|uniref:Mannosylglycerate hydrolase n=1 Tax=Streptococcus zhangguiae TaxID=2664091 RepID=A0A6I4RRJ0_9STRE|nr:MULTISPECIES: mannosylglycerate hydrolase [unclassified Streptococcus]MTB64752.1 mannosylglycerate hydrolase [Streptococcus sp. zg-86]MTB91324.1 mannosylglycerate hydrolase [Streptococcus sp. zg-36]MWV56745.1 mannosylglycerate hydrolase [Streptococcus sp. zg-70]QTH48477.1 mannosylglycerate hydrolase [Streptococcus sp. zg-86]